MPPDACDFHLVSDLMRSGVMSNTNKDISKEVVTTKPPKAAATPTRLALLGPPPLLEGEERAAYEQHLARVTEAVKPADILEEIWVRDFVDHDWVICRLRRFQTSLLTANAHDGLKEIIRPLMPWSSAAINLMLSSPDASDLMRLSSEASDLATRWATRKPSAINKVNRLLAAAGLTMDAVMAQTLSLNIDVIERIDRMIMSEEARRNAVLHEVERHRASLGQALRRVSEVVEDVQFEEVGAKPSPDGSAL